MAYMKNLFDFLEKENGQGLQNSNPILSAAGTQIDTTAQGSQGGMAAPRSPGSGTGYLGGTRSNKWVNIQDFLKANPSLSSMARQQGSGFISGEKGEFDKAAQPLRSASFGTKYYSDEDVEDLLTPGGNLYDVDAVKGAITQDYGGPMGVDYDPYKSGNLDRARKLTDRTTAMDVLAEPYIKQGAYGLGLRNLDQSLLGADQEYGGVTEGLSKDMKNFLEFQQGETKRLGEKASKFKEDAKTAREKATGQVGGFFDRKTKEFADKATQLNQMSDQKKKDWLKAYTDWFVNVKQRREQGKMPVPYDVDASSQAFRTLRPEEKWASGYLHGHGAATPWNVGGPEAYVGLQNAAQLLGKDPNLVKQQGSYQPTTWTNTGDMKTPQEIAADLGLVIEDIGGVPDIGNYYGWLQSHYDFSNPDAPVFQRTLEGSSPELKAYYDYIEQLAKQAGVGAPKPKALPAGGR